MGGTTVLRKTDKSLTVRVPLGAGRAMEMIFTARLLSAEEALAVGVVSEVLKGHEALMTRARELATTLAGHAPLTLRATKEAMRRVRMGRLDGSDLSLRTSWPARSVA